MKLSTMLNYAGDVRAAADEVAALERAGLDCVWVAEAYSFDAVSLMGYLAAKTERVEIGSAILNVYSRTPTLIAMTLAGLDSISGGRANCGLGASGPQVIEGFHGVPYLHPTKRIRETIEVCRQTWRRQPVELHGETVDIPVSRGERTGLGKALKLINHPVRPAIPIWWASLKPRSVEATAELADGWIPIFFIPDHADDVWGEALRDGRSRRSEALGDLQVLAGGTVRLTDDADEVTRTLDAGRPLAALYAGGMGARGKNFYHDLMAAYGWEAEADQIQELYLGGDKEAAARAVPRGFLEGSSLVGPEGHVKDRLAAFAAAGVTHLQMNLVGSVADKVRTVEAMRRLADTL